MIVDEAATIPKKPLILFVECHCKIPDLPNHRNHQISEEYWIDIYFEKDSTHIEPDDFHWLHSSGDLADMAISY